MYRLKDLHVRLTTDCNLKCQHCYAAEWAERNYELEYDLVKKIIIEAIELGCITVTFSGGEPFIYPHIYELLLFCERCGVKINIESNGTLINWEKLKLIKRMNMLKLKISYDGEQLRGEGAGVVKNNIIKLRKNGFNILIQTVLTRVNVCEINSILDFSEQLGIEHRLFLGHSKSGNGVNISNFKVQEVLSIKDKILKRYSHVTIELPEFISGKKQKGCGWGISRCEVMPNGDITSCAPLTYARKDFIAGNINDYSLKELWNSRHFQTIRELKQKQYKGICGCCKFFDDCRGSCRSVAASIGGNILSPYPYCEQYSDVSDN